MTLRSTLITSLAAGLLGASTWGICHGAEIHLLRSGKSAGEVVRLGDVADVTGASEEEASRLRDAQLCSAPIPGRSKKLTLGEIRESLARQGMNVVEFQFYGASRIEVTSIGERDDGQTLQKISKSAPLAANANRPRGTGERNEIRRVRLDAGVEAENSDDDSGEKAKPPMLVKRGQAVALTVRAAGVKVSTAAVAQADGAEGEMIVVRSAADRNKTFLARIVGPQAVEMHVGAATRTNASTRSLR